MINSSFLKKIILALSAVFIISCDTDYNNLGSDIIDDDVHHGMFQVEAGVTAYDRPTGIVQSNNLTLNTLGAYDNLVFGKTVAHFVTQVQLATVNPTLYAPEIDSVYLYVPYFSSIESTDATTGVSTYDLDSIYGAPETKIKLDVFRNGYFLRDSDPGTSFVSGQKYYSNDKSLIDAAVVGSRLNNFSTAQNDEFPISDDEIARSAIPDGQTESKVVERKAPGIFLYLDKTEFQNMLFGPAAAGKLVNNNIFKEYFRGLYFRVTQLEGQSVMVVPRFDQGVITIKYRDHNISTTESSGHTVDKFAKSMTLNLDGNTINFFENTPKEAFTTAINTSDAAAGDVRLYLKGGEGSMAFIDIDQATIDALKAESQGGQRVLINEANLVFYIDDNTETGMGQGPSDPKKKEKEPLRLLLYDVKNKRPLIDYSLDATTTTINPKYDKFVHGGIREDENGRGTKYKIRITDHINNLVNKDSTNVKLGLVVAEYINLTGNAALKSPFTETTGATAPVTVSTVPVTSVMHPFGTILYGSNSAVPENKRLKLEIFYTKPN
ncbi:DUF4270 domain-containing protein [Flavobacterium album]|uniref:DUF4270 domain-containing protein n=1 Tax=Flavobacterium album TaxID=2175091 RepID=A0A2S1QW18_9FLAO|nr:DUF4270 domain-containing protein [Flavobacterium album]AWH84617.1 DUF4270 domain-containing protein [Flavobacterium album]